jgi:hypothetical protein
VRTFRDCSSASLSLHRLPHGGHPNNPADRRYSIHGAEQPAPASSAAGFQKGPRWLRDRLKR